MRSTSSSTGRPDAPSQQARWGRLHDGDDGQRGHPQCQGGRHRHRTRHRWATRHEPQKGTGRVVVELPPTSTTPKRTIKAPSLIALGTDADGLKSANFDGGVDFRETQPAAKKGDAATERTATATHMALKLNGDLGAISIAQFSGAFWFKDGDISAKADQGIATSRKAICTSSRPRASA